MKSVSFEPEGMGSYAFAITLCASGYKLSRSIFNEIEGKKKRKLLVDICDLLLKPIKT